MIKDFSKKQPLLPLPPQAALPLLAFPVLPPAQAALMNVLLFSLFRLLLALGNRGCQDMDKVYDTCFRHC
ncbi:MAG UNVERIFIED_CONTAM: hypothetical protein LVR29_09100 [Microcystis novacekii LVE1205-3]|jgi:hypothetical protein